MKSSFLYKFCHLSLLSIVSVATIDGFSSAPANALVGTGQFKSIKNGTCRHPAFPTNSLSCWFIDPPITSTITEINFEMQYDSSKIRIIPELSGFLCEFSQNGDCPSISDTDFQNILLGDEPRSNTSTELIIDNSSLSYTHDLSKNPIPPLQEETFFLGIAYEVLIPFDQIIIHNTQNTGDMFQLPSTCGTPTGTIDCGSDSPTFGMSFVSTPEPTSTLSLISLGILGVGATLKRKQKRTDSVEKEPIKVG